jgi:hypothetical protein
MRMGDWAEIADVSGIECVGVVKSCPGGEFAPGTKVAALMGGLGRTINGSYAEYTRAPVTNVAAIESDLPWAELAAIPETYATWRTRSRPPRKVCGYDRRPPRGGGAAHAGRVDRLAAALTRLRRLRRAGVVPGTVRSERKGAGDDVRAALEDQPGQRR